MPMSKSGTKIFSRFLFPRVSSTVLPLLSSLVSLVVVPAELVHLLVTVLPILVDTWNPILVHKYVGIPIDNAY
jgi:hypothetical protein